MKQSTKALIRSLYVRCHDWLHRTPFASTQIAGEDTMPVQLELTQPFKPSATLESKKHNLREAASCINQLIINPGEVFSFWHCVGNPNNRKRFMEGRSIHAGKLSIDVGGGLCQASGIIHHLALIAGLQVLERWNHSVDLYTDETRFAPLGSDATVFYGFKDLRLINNLSQPIQFHLNIEAEQIRAQICASQNIENHSLTFDIQLKDDGKKLVKVRNEAGKTVSQSEYECLKN